MGNLPGQQKERPGTLGPRMDSPKKELRLDIRDGLWKIKFLVILTFFLATAGAFSSCVFQKRQEKKLPPPTQIFVPTPTSEISPPPTPLEVEQIRGLINEFETAYKAKDAKSLLFTYMTEPATEEERDLRSILYQGKDTKGNPGGPVLFGSASASSYVVDYQILEIKKLDGSYRVRIKEDYSYWNNVAGREEGGRE